MSKMWEQKEENRKDEWINNMKKELPRLENATEADILLDSLRATLKKVPNWKKLGNNSVYGLWFKGFTSIHDRLVLQW